MAIVRVKPGVASSVYDAPNDTYVPLTEGAPYDDDSYVARTYWWAFAYDNGADMPGPARRGRPPKVEQATAAPGELR